MSNDCMPNSVDITSVSPTVIPTSVISTIETSSTAGSCPVIPTSQPPTPPPPVHSIPPGLRLGPPTITSSTPTTSTSTTSITNITTLTTSSTLTSISTTTRQVTILTLKQGNRIPTPVTSPDRVTSTFKLATTSTLTSINTEWDTLTLKINVPTTGPNTQLLAPSRSKIADQLLSNESRTSQLPQVSESSTASLFGSISTSTSSTQGGITTPSTLPTSIFQESPGMSTTISVVSASTSPPDLLPDRKPSRFGTADILAITFGIVSLCLILFILFGMIKRRRQGMSSDQRRRGPGNDPECSEVRMPVDLSIFKPPLEEVSEGSEPSNHSTREEESTRTTEVQPNFIEPPLQSPRSRLQNILVQTALVVPENATPHSPSLISNRTRTTVRTTPPQYEESLASNEVRLAGGPVVRMGRAI